jgi:DNA-binding PadR family transcriptional regulator
MSVKYAILGILSQQERHGYDLKGAFDERVGDFWSLNYGQIYSTLDRMEREGLVEWHEEAQERRPDRKIYRITPKGRSELERWLTEPVSRARALRDELFIKLLFLDSANPEPILNLIQEQKRVYLRHMQKLTQRKYALSKRPDRDDAIMTELLIDAALFHAEADIRWITMTEEKLLERWRKKN